MAKQLPHSLEAEQAVIGSIIIDPNQIILIKELLQPTFFYSKVNELIYEALVDLNNSKKTIDFITIKEQLSATNSLEEVGGMDYIIDLAEDVTIAINVMEYAKIVYEKFLIRDTIRRATNILTSGYEMNSSAELIEFAEKEIFDLAKLTRSEEFLVWEDLIDEAHEKIRQLVASPNNKLTGLSTGFKNLDDLTNGLQKSDLIILAARPSVGKTAYALNLAKNVCASTKNTKASVAVFSLEMSADQLITRILACQSAVPISNIRTGYLSVEEQEQINYGLEKLKEYNMHIDETPGIKIGDLKSKCRKLKVEKGLDLVVIDYLQLITTGGNGDNRQQEVSLISRELKAMAKELQVPVIALSQLSRGVESRADKKPMMSDIRESGAIEQDADIIMMLYRPEYYGSNIEMEDGVEMYDGKTQLLIAKNRNGATGEIEFKFQKEINKFVSVVAID